MAPPSPGAGERSHPGHADVAGGADFESTPQPEMVRTVEAIHVEAGGIAARLAGRSPHTVALVDEACPAGGPEETSVEEEGEEEAQRRDEGFMQRLLEQPWSPKRSAAASWVAPKSAHIPAPRLPKKLPALAKRESSEASAEPPPTREGREVAGDETCKPSPRSYARHEEEPPSRQGEDAHHAADAACISTASEAESSPEGACPSDQPLRPATEHSLPLLFEAGSVARDGEAPVAWASMGSGGEALEREAGGGTEAAAPPAVRRWSLLARLRFFFFGR